MLTIENNIRYDIVFLRCLAIVAVVCYHFKLMLFSDGYAGVDIFFVLSGFLMTQIISQQLNSNTFNLKDFYFRRLARVLPALLFVILVFLLLIYAVLGIKLYDFSRFALSSTLFVSNIHYYHSSGYFAPSSQLNFLLHTWSLSVEWQFYLIYPLVWLGFGKWLKRKSYFVPILLLSLLWLLSLLCMFYYVQVKESFAFYMFPARAWELLTGAFAFFLGPILTKRWSLLLKNLLSIVLLVSLLLALSGYLQIGRWGWPSTATLLPVGLTLFVLLIGPDYRLFRSAPVVYAARISYSWYLWHWPIVVLSTYFAWDQVFEARVFFFFMSIAVSTLAYHLVEKRHRFRAPNVLVGGILLTVLITFSLTQIPLKRLLFFGSQSSLAQFQRVYPVQYAPAQYDFGRGHLLANSSFDSYDRQHLFRISDSTYNYLLLGDCHAGMFSATLRDLANNNKVNLIQATADEAFPVPGVASVFQGPSDLMDFMYENYLPTNMSKIDKVILAANYASYSKKQLIAYFNRIDTFFATYNVPVVFIGQTESYRVEYPVVETLHRRFGLDKSDYLVPARYYVNQFLKRSKIASRYIDVYDLPKIKHGDASQAYFYDGDHLSTFGTDQYKELLQQYIFER
ncbi:acyltransferase family protein [Sphingobacterium bambusae]|uniref:Acyltransferase family protein n=1 Tax=Sphingobacterium bambusae TaxID=662858 RepID=A0ABW6BFJ2_9SPHI|nr:acyltransferase family protein [Sphingobacterium bambusae]WPL50203.1 acyltransferase family protein [Sphingobacterium bambusae]